MSVIRRGSRFTTNMVKRYFSSNHEYDNLYMVHNEFQEQTNCQREQIQEQSKKLLKIAILGLPNTGKSTLINQLVKRPVCAASCRIHTTRLNSFAIYNEKDTQLVFIDTPGLTTKDDIKKFKLEKRMDADVKTSINEADVIGVMQDLQVPKARQSISKRVLELIPFAKADTPFILILNKVDIIKEKSLLLEVVNNLTECKEILFTDIFMVSALKNSGVDDLRNYFLDMAKPNKWIYEEDIYTNQTPHEIVEQVVRAKLLDNIKQEIPYNLELKITHLDFDIANNLVVIVEIIPERNRHYGIILGHKGVRIRIVTLQIEQALANIFHTGVKLRLQIEMRKKNKENVSN